MSDMPLDPRLPALLRQMRLQVRPERFALVGMHPRERPVALRLLGLVQSPFLQLISEPQQLTLLLPERDWNELRPAFAQASVQAPLRVISFGLDLPPDLVGFMATVSAALAQAGVPLLAVCAFSQDHLLVLDPYLIAARQALEELAAGPTPP